jgi:hypothetical protein
MCDVATAGRSASEWAAGRRYLRSTEKAVAERPRALRRHWTTRDRAANVRLFRLAAEILPAPDRLALPALPGAEPMRGGR